MISVQVEIYPGRGLVQFPHTGWDCALQKVGKPFCMFQAVISPNPDAQLFRVYLAASIRAPSTRTVAGMLGASRFRAEEGHVLDATVPATLTG
jgi:hypothetical protein